MEYDLLNVPENIEQNVSWKEPQAEENRPRSQLLLLEDQVQQLQHHLDCFLELSDRRDLQWLQQTPLQTHWRKDKDCW